MVELQLGQTRQTLAPCFVTGDHSVITGPARGPSIFSAWAAAQRNHRPTRWVDLSGCRGLTWIVLSCIEFIDMY